MEDFFNGLTVISVHDDLHRNIVSLRTSVDIFDDLTDSPQGWQAAIDLEQATKPRFYTSTQPIIDRPFEEAAYHNAIGYPFRHWANSRYSDGSYGVWYGADTLETTVHETVYHWRRGLLEDAGWENREDVVSERKVYRVRCDAALFDFLPRLKDYPTLTNPDPNGYHFTQQLGARIHHDGHPGLRSRSARCNGDVYAIFNPRVLSHPRQVCYLSYRLSGGQVAVERQPGEILLTL